MGRSNYSAAEINAALAATTREDQERILRQQEWVSTHASVVQDILAARKARIISRRAKGVKQPPVIPQPKQPGGVPSAPVPSQGVTPHEVPFGSPEALHADPWFGRVKALNLGELDPTLRDKMYQSYISFGGIPTSNVAEQLQTLYGSRLEPYFQAARDSREQSDAPSNRGDLINEALGGSSQQTVAEDYGAWQEVLPPNRLSDWQGLIESSLPKARELTEKQRAQAWQAWGLGDRPQNEARGVIQEIERGQRPLLPINPTNLAAEFRRNIGEPVETDKYGNDIVKPGWIQVGRTQYPIDVLTEYYQGIHGPGGGLMFKGDPTDPVMGAKAMKQMGNTIRPNAGWVPVDASGKSLLEPEEIGLGKAGQHDIGMRVHAFVVFGETGEKGQMAVRPGLIKGMSTYKTVRVPIASDIDIEKLSLARPGSVWEQGDVSLAGGLSPIDFGLGRKVSQVTLENIGLVAGEEGDKYKNYLTATLRLYANNAQTSPGNKGGTSRHQLYPDPILDELGFEALVSAKYLENVPQNYFANRPAEFARALGLGGADATEEELATLGRQASWNAETSQRAADYFFNTILPRDMTEILVPTVIPASQLYRYENVIDPSQEPLDLGDGKLLIQRRMRGIDAENFSLKIPMRSYPGKKNYVSDEQIREMARYDTEGAAQLRAQADAQDAARISLIEAAARTADPKLERPDLVDFRGKDRTTYENIMDTARQRAAAVGGPWKKEMGEEYIPADILAKNFWEVAAESEIGGKQIYMGAAGVLMSPQAILHQMSGQGALHAGGTSSKMAKAAYDYFANVDSKDREIRSRAIKSSLLAIGEQQKMATSPKAIKQLHGAMHSPNVFSGIFRADSSIAPNEVYLPDKFIFKALGVTRQEDKDRLLKQMQSGSEEKIGAYVTGYPGTGRDFEIGKLSVRFMSQYKGEQAMGPIVSPLLAEALGRDFDLDPAMAILTGKLQANPDTGQFFMKDRPQIASVTDITRMALEMRKRGRGSEVLDLPLSAAEVQEKYNNLNEFSQEQLADASKSALLLKRLTGSDYNILKRQLGQRTQTEQQQAVAEELHQNVYSYRQASKAIPDPHLAAAVEMLATASAKRGYGERVIENGKLTYRYSKGRPASVMTIFKNVFRELTQAKGATGEYVFDTNDLASLFATDKNQQAVAEYGEALRRNPNLAFEYAPGKVLSGENWLDTMLSTPMGQTLLGKVQNTQWPKTPRSWLGSGISKEQEVAVQEQAALYRAIQKEYSKQPVSPATRARADMVIRKRREEDEKYYEPFWTEPKDKERPNILPKAEINLAKKQKPAPATAPEQPTREATQTAPSEKQPTQEPDSTATSKQPPREAAQTTPSEKQPTQKSDSVAAPGPQATRKPITVTEPLAMPEPGHLPQVPLGINMARASGVHLAAPAERSTEAPPATPINFATPPQEESPVEVSEVSGIPDPGLTTPPSEYERALQDEGHDAPPPITKAQREARRVKAAGNTAGTIENQLRSAGINSVGEGLASLAGLLGNNPSAQAAQGLVTFNKLGATAGELIKAIEQWTGGIIKGYDATKGMTEEQLKHISLLKTARDTLKREMSVSNLALQQEGLKEQDIAALQKRNERADMALSKLSKVIAPWLDTGIAQATAQVSNERVAEITRRMMGGGGPGDGGGGPEGGPGILGQAWAGAGRIGTKLMSGWSLMQLNRIWGLTGGATIADMPIAAQQEMAASQAAMAGQPGVSAPLGTVARGLLSTQARQAAYRGTVGRTAYQAYGGGMGAMTSPTMGGAMGLAGIPIGLGAVSGIVAGWAGLPAWGGLAAAGPVGLAVGGAAALYGAVNYVQEVNRTDLTAATALNSTNWFERTAAQATMGGGSPDERMRQLQSAATHMSPEYEYTPPAQLATDTRTGRVQQLAARIASGKMSGMDIQERTATMRSFYANKIAEGGALNEKLGYLGEEQFLSGAGQYMAYIDETNLNTMAADPMLEALARGDVNAQQLGNLSLAFGGRGTDIQHGYGIIGGENGLTPTQAAIGMTVSNKYMQPLTFGPHAAMSRSAAGALFEKMGRMGIGEEGTRFGDLLTAAASGDIETVAWAMDQSGLGAMKPAELPMQATSAGRMLALYRQRLYQTRQRDESRSYQQIQFGLRQQGIDLSYQGAMAQAGIQMQRLQLSYRQTMGDEPGTPDGYVGRFGWREQQMALQQSQFMSNWALQGAMMGENQSWQRTQQAWQGQAIERNWQRTQAQRGWEDTAIEQGQERQGVQYGWQIQGLQISQEMAGISRAGTRAGWAYGEERGALQFGWQQEDITENIRYASGRQRKQLITQQERTTTLYNMEQGQASAAKDRQEEIWDLEDKRFDIRREQIEQQQKWAEEDFATSKEHRDEKRKWEDEDHKTAKDHLNEQKKHTEAIASLQNKQHAQSLANYVASHSLQMAQMAEEKRAFTEQHDLNIKAAGISAGLAAQQRDLAQEGLDAAIKHQGVMNTLADAQSQLAFEESVRMLQWINFIRDNIPHLLEDMVRKEMANYTPDPIELPVHVGPR